MAPHPPNPPHAREANQPVQEIVDRALSLNFDSPKKPIIQLQNRQNQQPPATVTVIANAPTTTVITAPPATSSPIDQSDQSVETSSSLNGGAIAGIVIGSIVGLLLLIWIFRSCSNLGAPPTDTPPRDGRAWYDGVRSDYPPPDAPRSPYRSSHPRPHHRHHHHSSRSRSRHSHGHYRRSADIQEVQQVTPVAVVRDSSRRSRRASRSPYRMYEADLPYDDGRGRSRSVSRRRYD
ncbi:hypothetical protein QBC37DRAFT_60269 [Rhypophila decipiens]|uniref:Uncharacterized protein n=1 Tax=Rhypophila decipiens TaxID=261697 RepID=A0AAN6XYI8_9PEZI|nr:hypothetical protein QBC37DRAFT_60269 [Rhypophila decipiens]